MIKREKLVFVFLAFGFAVLSYFAFKAEKTSAETWSEDFTRSVCEGVSNGVGTQLLTVPPETLVSDCRNGGYLPPLSSGENVPFIAGSVVNPESIVQPWGLTGPETPKMPCPSDLNSECIDWAKVEEKKALKLISAQVADIARAIERFILEIA